MAELLPLQETEPADPKGSINTDQQGTHAVDEAIEQEAAKNNSVENPENTETDCNLKTDNVHLGLQKTEAVFIETNTKLVLEETKDQNHSTCTERVLDEAKEQENNIDTVLEESSEGQGNNLNDVAEIKTETSEKTKRLSRSERKRKRHEEVIQQRKEDRKRKKTERKIQQRDNSEAKDSSAEGHKSKRDIKEEVRLKCEAALKTGQKICIDCSLEEHMSNKEKGKLAMQVGRLYGANKRSDSPAHIYISGLKPEGKLYKELVKKNDGFLKYLINIEEKSHTELFPLDTIVALSPDSETVLEDIDPDKVYVIGGLVDESITKNITVSRAGEAGISTARLPIDEYMMKIDQPSHSKVLAVNQVVEILLNYMSTKCWKTALSTGVPKRKGFVVNEDAPDTKCS